MDKVKKVPLQANPVGGKVRKKSKNRSLKKSFAKAMGITVFTILVLSLLSIYGAYLIQKRIMPDSNQVWMTIEEKHPDGTVTEDGQLITFGERTERLQLVGAEGSVKTNDMYFTIKPENADYAMLTPKRKLAYKGLFVFMFLLPVIFAMTGVGLCGWWFYRKKLAPPLKILSDATEEISEKNLDFSVSYDSEDELGKLCESFEEMREALYENTIELWNMVEDRKKLQASVAHDLRNPIAIISGYVDFLKTNIPKGNIREEKLLHILDNLSDTSKRMEVYTDSIRNINQIEDLQVEKNECDLQEIFNGIIDDFKVLAEQQNLQFKIINEVEEYQAQFDRQCFYRILENVFANALRYADTTIVMKLKREEDNLITTLSDDGHGFTRENLQEKNKMLFYSKAADGHMGMGLTVSRILSKKMGGYIELGNNPNGGASVKIFVKI